VLHLLPMPRHIRLGIGHAGSDPLPPQGYRLVVDDGGVAQVDAADAAGAFYAQQTLAQLPADAGPVVIEDWPDVAVRGVMLDVSRDKVPTMATLIALVDRLSSWKVNQLQLYMEHTFAYTGHDDVWRDASPFTPDELRDLDAHCRSRHVELVPNQNCLGHLERWLVHERYRSLAIRPDGWIDGRGRTRQPTTIDPANPASLDFVRGLLRELLACFTSERVHVGLDEPWELPDERFGDYVDFVRRLRDAPELDGREMLVWGDIVARHPDRTGDVPPGVTVCEWGYEADHPFDERAAALAASGLPFWVCPGTSSWNSVVGRGTNARRNSEAAARAAVAHGAAGYLVTDWGDNGHLQHLPVSEPAIAHAAGVAWCAAANEGDDVVDGTDAVSAHVFADATGELSRALHELGDAHLAVRPQVPNASVLVLALLSPRIRMGDGVTAGVTDDDLGAAKDVVASAMARLDRARPARADGALVVDEVRASAALVDLLIDDARARLRAGGTIDAVPASQRAHLADRLWPMVDRHRDLWLQRNRPGGLDDSCARLQRLLDVYAGDAGDAGGGR
jgi:hexosaminidase